MKILYTLTFLLLTCQARPKENAQNDSGDYYKLQKQVKMLMKAYQIPGGVIGFSINDSVFIDGLGLKDKEKKLPVTINTKFRIASISKSLTAVGVLKLVEQDELSLNDKVVEWLRKGGFKVSNIIDERWTKITIEDLLYHTGGWSHLDHNDPMLNIRRPGKKWENQSPPGSSEIINDMMQEPLGFEPSSRYVYSNFGYNLLGRIIVIASGVTYEEYIRKAILDPLDMNNTFPGKTRVKERLKGESKYYDYPGAVSFQSVFTSLTSKVSRPYGTFYLEALSSCGGWVSTAADLLRFVESLDIILDARTQKMMLDLPAHVRSNSATYYAMGWNVAVGAEEKVFWHTGSLPGTSTTLVKLNDKISFVAMFNSRDRNLTFLSEVSDLIVDFLNQ